MKIAGFWVRFVLLGLLLSSLLPLSARADGMAIAPNPNPHGNRWDYVDEKSQQAFINFENGQEKLVLVADLADTSKDVVWIVPVPSDPESVIVEISRSLPDLYGTEVTESAKNRLDNTMDSLLGTQIYPLIYTRSAINSSTGSFSAIPISSRGIEKVAK